MSFGARLAAIRKERKLTQEQLGKGLGTDGADASKSVVYGWEKDQHYPRVDQLMLICKKLKCSADYLLFGEVAFVSPKLKAAQEAVKELSDEERLALFTAIQQPGLPDSAVEEKIPVTKRAKGWIDPVQKEAHEGDDVRRVQDQDDARTASGGDGKSQKRRSHRASGVG